jgi:hypothetical protein
MRKEIKELLKDELKAVKDSKLKLAIGYALVGLISILLLAGVINLISLVALIPLVFVVRKQKKEFRLNLMMLDFTRVLIDDEYGVEFKGKNK